MQYILFDVDKIKDYVFESFKPKEVKGASELIKCLDYYSKTRMSELMSQLKKNFPGLGVVYAKGGGGLLKTNDSNGQEICNWLEKNFSEYLKEGGSLTAVCHPLEKDFKTTYAILNYLVRDRKSEKRLILPLSSVEFQGEKSKCESCGKRLHTNESLRFCSICLEKRQKGKTEVQSLEDISDKELLVIYGDLNEAGAHLAALEEEQDLADFSETVYQTLQAKRLEIEEKLKAKGFKYLMPVIGGDDMIVFTHPNSFELIKDLLFSIEEILGKKLNKPVKMNFSFLVAKYNFPIYHLFKISESLLEKTKDAYYKDKSKQTHHGFFWLWEGEYMPTERDVYTQKEFSDIFNTAKHIHGPGSRIKRSSLHQLMDLVSDRYEGKEKQLNTEYFLARHSEYESFVVQKDRGVDFMLNYEGKKIKLTRDLLEDIIHMENLLYKEKGKNKEEK
ncbi:MAG: hypothetical protein JSV88_13230 [Candidatus Aminicenantes bacterium]|nr:MAG: hypothetical protein JSV88_13230 [Candidatus Aminicenantes bacterium]